MSTYNAIALEKSWSFRRLPAHGAAAFEGGPASAEAFLADTEPRTVLLHGAQLSKVVRRGCW